MFSSGPNYSKLKTNLRLCINRLKLLEKKKTELALKSRKEIADYIAMGKVERAKIRVEHIIREDYLVEAMELLEMFCDLLLARFGLIQQMKTLDDGLAEAISSIIWVAPRLQADVQELKIVSDQLSAKYGSPYAMACRENAVGTVSEKLMHKLSVQAPPKLTVEKYLIEIAKYYNVEYEPDPQILSQDEVYAADALIDLAPAPPLPEKSDGPSGGGGATGGSGGGGGATQSYVPFNYPTSSQPGASGGGLPAYSGGASAYPAPPSHFPTQSGSTASAPYGGGFNIPPTCSNGEKKGNFDYDDGPPPYFPPDLGSNEKTSPDKKSQSGNGAAANSQNSAAEMKNATASSNQANDQLDLPELPGVPTDTPTHEASPDNEDGKKNADDDQEIDFDDLTKRFEALKKRK